ALSLSTPHWRLLFSMAEELLNKLPEALLEHTLNLKKAARSLFDEQIKQQIQNNKREEQERKQLLLTMMAADKRSPSEFLYLMNETIEHSTGCSSFDCEWGTRCWRMKGMLFHISKLKDEKRLTPSAMVTLWNKQLELEMHTEACEKMKKECVCQTLDNYKYFFMKCVSDLRKGRIAAYPAGKERNEMGPSHTLYPVYVHFKKELEKRQQEDQSGDKQKRSAFHLLGKIITGDYGEAAREAAQERDRKMKEAADLAGKAVDAAESVMGKKLSDSLHEAAMKRGIIGDVDNLLRDIVKGEGKAVDADSSLPGSSSPQPPTTKEKTGKCDHGPVRKCNHAFDEKEVDLQLGTRERIVKTKGNTREASKETLAVLRSRIASIIESRGAEKRPSNRVVVRVITITVDGVRWTVAYNGEIHNLYDFDCFTDCVTKLMFAMNFYKDVQVVLFNFVPEKGSEGLERMEGLMRDHGVQNLVVENINYIPKWMKESLSSQLLNNYKMVQKRAKDIAAKHGPKEVWWSGCYVKFNGKVHEHVWKQRLASDRTSFAKIVAHHGMKTPEEMFGYSRGTHELTARERQAEEQLRKMREEYEYLAKSLAQRKVLKHTSTLPAQNNEALNALSNKLQQIQLDSAQYKQLIDGMETMKSMQEKHGSNFLQMLGGSTMQFQSKEALKMQATKSFPVDANGLPYIPAELVAMCSKTTILGQSSSTATKTPSKSMTKQQATAQSSKAKETNFEAMLNGPSLDDVSPSVVSAYEAFIQKLNDLKKTSEISAMDEDERKRRGESSADTVESTREEEEDEEEELLDAGQLEDDDGIEWLSDEMGCVLETDSELEESNDGTMGYRTEPAMDNHKNRTN
ncbi:hypothetical protein PMAYCL1PPCAC_06233, partial [Pristionchus mayeri]